MSFVQYPAFVIRKDDDIVSILCKVCGVPIAGLTERVKDVRLGRNGNRIETKVLRFTRFHNFTELKMVCNPGQFHITVGCNKCLTPGLAPEALDELMEADLNEQASQLDKEYYTEMKARMPTGVVAVKVGGGIL